MAKSAPSHRATQHATVSFPQEVTVEELEQWWADSAKKQRIEKPVRTLKDLCLGAIFPRVKPKPSHPTRHSVAGG